MLVRLIFWIGSILILIKENDGYVRTYADEYFGRIRGPNQKTGVDAAILFLIVFGILVGGFFIFCILGTLIFGLFDIGFRCPQRPSFHRTSASNSNVNPFMSGLYRIRYYQNNIRYKSHQLRLIFQTHIVEGQGTDEKGQYILKGTYSNENMCMDLKKQYKIEIDDLISIHLIWCPKKKYFYGQYTFQTNQSAEKNYVELKFLKHMNIV